MRKARLGGVVAAASLLVTAVGMVALLMRPEARRIAAESFKRSVLGLKDIESAVSQAVGVRVGETSAVDQERLKAQWKNVGY